MIEASVAMSDLPPTSDPLSRRQPVSFDLSKAQVQSIAVYHLLLLLVGFAVSIFALLATSTAITSRAVLGASALGACGGSAYYLRRLYKAGIQGRITLLKEAGDASKRFGVTLYLFSRPLIAVLLAFIATLALLVSVVSVSDASPKLGEGFVYYSMLLGFVTGFSSGTVLQRIEKDGIEAFRRSEDARP